MINGFRDTVSIIIVRACSEVSIEGEWLASELMKCITDLSNAGFKVREIVTDIHATNAFRNLLNNNNGDKKHYFIISGSCDKTYIFLILSICWKILETISWVLPNLYFQALNLRFVNSVCHLICFWIHLFG